MAALDQQQFRRKASTEQGTKADNWPVNELPYEALIAEATVNSMRCVILQNIAKSTEKAIHLTEDHPIRITFEGFFRSRLKRRNERSEVEKLCKELGVHRCALFISFTVKPWENRLGKIYIFPTLICQSGKDDNVHTIRTAARNGPLKLVLTLMSTPTAQHLAAYWME